MSYVQPLITSAFSSYTVNYSSRHTAGSQRNDGTTEDKASGIVSGSDKIITGNSTALIGAVHKSQENKGIADDGKPKSVSGDVLDLSERAKLELETKAESKTNSKITLQDEANAENSVPLAGSLKSEEEKDGKLSGGKAAEELSAEEKQQVEELKSRDAEVRLHESRHVASGGQYVTSGPSYTYQTGPDGEKYAIGGEVGIDVSPVKDDPEATIRKMQTVAAAALAPAEPSGQDYKVAAQARQTESEARAELSKQTAEGTLQKEDEQKKDENEKISDLKSDAGSAPQQDAEKSETSLSGLRTASRSKNTASITSHYAKSFAAGSVGKMVSGQTSGTRFSAFA